MRGGLRRPKGPLQVSCVLAAMVFVAAFSISPTYAQNRNRWFPEKQNFGAIGERLNANTLTVVSGTLNGTYLSVAHDLAAVLTLGAELRILPPMRQDRRQHKRHRPVLHRVY